jgi:hypothetical protein
VLGLADVLENARRGFRQVLGLDILRFLTMAKASWHAALYRSGAEIELVTEQQLADDIEAGLRGGLSCPFQPHAVANDPMTSTYDPSKEPSIIVYNDATNLYGWCMLQPLPCSNYRAVEARLEDLVRDYLPDDCVGYILVIDYECPRDCHDMAIPPLVKGEVGGSKKLYPSLEPQEEYVISLPHLIRYLHQGVRVTKVHRVWAFDQKPFLREHMTRLGQERAKATSDSVKAACKTASVSLYGCTLENKKNHTSVEMFFDPCRWELSVAKNYHPGARAWVQHHDDQGFIGYRVRKPSKDVIMDTPRIVGFMILEYAKIRMLDFQLRMREIARPTLLYMDTDSAIMQLHGERCPYEVMRRAPDMFDFKAGKFLGYEQTGREGELGLFKNELLDDGVEERIVEYCASEAKTYSLKKERFREGQRIDDKVEVKCKGVPKAAVKMQIYHEHVKAAALNHEMKEVEFRAIRMKKCEPHHTFQKKVAMRGNNTKVHRLADGTCVPHGHWRISA